MLLSDILRVRVGPFVQIVPSSPSSSTSVDCDDALMARAATGDAQAFRALVDRYMDALLRYCCKQLGDVRRGEEVAQETWLRVWNMRSRYRAEGKFRTILYSSARNLCRNHWRDRLRRDTWLVRARRELAIEPANASTPLSALIDNAEALAVQRALGMLKPKLRETLLLRFDQDLDYSEIAQIVGRSESTVRSRIFHGLKRLRAELEGDDA